MALFQIVTFDGGGVYGAISAALMTRLERARPGFVESVDLFSGTSTGGIIALLLAAGFSAAEVLEFYRSIGQSIFPFEVKRRIRGADGLLHSRYSNVPLKRALSSKFGSLRICDLTKKVLIPAFKLDSSDGNSRAWKTAFFSNMGSNPSTDLVVDVALRTSAAPVMFPSHQGFVDGGLTVNNPSMCALSECVAQGMTMTDIRLLSVGTGIAEDFIKGDVDWGAARWIVPLLRIMLLAGMDVQDFHCQQMLGPRQYHRVNTVAPGSVQMDDASKIPRLIDIADAADITPALQWISEFSPIAKAG